MPSLNAHNLMKKKKKKERKKFEETKQKGCKNCHNGIALQYISILPFTTDDDFLRQNDMCLSNK